MEQIFAPPYEGPKKTTKQVRELLGKYLFRLEKKMVVPSGIVLEAWPKVVDPSLVGCTRAERFEEGILYVKVAHSMAMSMLRGSAQKKQLLAQLHRIVPQVVVSDILFSIG